VDGQFWKDTPLLAKPGAYGAPRFSPDGKRLAFTAWGSKGPDVWVYDWERDTPTQLTFTGPGNLEIAWAPDGKHIVFGSRAAGTAALWWIRSDGSGEPQKLLERKNTGVGLRPQTDSCILAFQQLLRFAGSVGTYPPQSGGACRARSEYDVLPVRGPGNFKIAGTGERELRGCVALPIVDPHVRTFAAPRRKCQPLAVGRKTRSAVRAWFGQQRCVFPELSIHTMG